MIYVTTTPSTDLSSKVCHDEPLISRLALPLMQQEYIFIAKTYYSIRSNSAGWAFIVLHNNSIPPVPLRVHPVIHRLSSEHRKLLPVSQLTPAHIRDILLKTTHLTNETISSTSPIRASAGVA